MLDIRKIWFTFYDRKVPVRQKKSPKPLRAEKVQKGLQSGTAADGQRGPPRAGGRRPSRLGPRCATPEPNTVPNTVLGRNEPEGSFKRRTHQPTARKKNLQLIANRRNPLSFTGLVLSDVRICDRGRVTQSALIYMTYINPHSGVYTQFSRVLLFVKFLHTRYFRTPFHSKDWHAKA